LKKTFTVRASSIFAALEATWLRNLVYFPIIVLAASYLDGKRGRLQIPISLFRLLIYCFRVLLQKVRFVIFEDIENLNRLLFTLLFTLVQRKLDFNLISVSLIF